MAAELPEGRKKNLRVPVLLSGFVPLERYVEDAPKLYAEGVPQNSAVGILPNMTATRK
jgi:hypothetical protein